MSGINRHSPGIVGPSSIVALILHTKEILCNNIYVIARVAISLLKNVEPEVVWQVSGCVCVCVVNALRLIFLKENVWAMPYHECGILK